ncbi:MAG: putative sensor domain DACNV-containing protein [Kofleriaceae bacterium]
MNEERLGSPSEFATQLASHLARFHDPTLPIPDPRQLAALVDAMFFASLHEEEARRGDFGVAWQPDSRDCAAVVAIAVPVLATPKNLAKLAPATSGEATSIALRQVGDEILAWAILERSAATQQPLTIRALDPGVLRVDYAGVPRALYARGEILLLGGDSDVQSPSRWLTQTFAAWSANANSLVEVDLRAVVVVRIALQVLTHRHGGMILLMPADVAEPQGVRAHYAVHEGADVMVKRYERVIRNVPADVQLARLKGSRARRPDGRISVRDEDQIAFAETIELVARLTAVDNALLLDTDLKIRGFGVQVIEGEAPQTSFRHLNPYTADTHVDDLSTFMGTRHPAGVIYCMRQPREAAAIIASQDGHLTLAIKDPHGGVQVVGSYDHAFGWR